eukprot:scaffold11516_cov63-Phaeocystis_antarctica.AAC.3
MPASSARLISARCSSLLGHALSMVVRWYSLANPRMSSLSNSVHARLVSPPSSIRTNVVVRLLLRCSADLPNTLAVCSFGSMPRCAISCCKASTSSVRPSVCKTTEEQGVGGYCRPHSRLHSPLHQRPLLVAAGARL